MTYHAFVDASGELYGSFEVFYADAGLCSDLAGPQFATGVPAEERITYQPGWYWWAGFPGCLPDGDPSGPFETEQEALQDALGES
jgi:hypothetical protein